MVGGERDSGRRWRPMVRVVAVMVLAGALVLLIVGDVRPPRPVTGPHLPSTPSRSPTPTPTPDPSPPTIEQRVCEVIAPRRPLRLLSFNIHRAHGPSGSLDAIAAEIAEVEADVVMLQEVDRFQPRSGHVDQAGHLALALGMHHSFSANLVRGDSEYGTAILSKHRIIRQGRIPLHRRPGAEPRALQWVTIEVGGHRVRVFNTHLEARRPRARLRQVRQVRDVVTAVRLPVVVGGDLNSWPVSRAIELLGRHLTDTWTMGEGRAVTGRGGRKIDYLFVGGERLRPVHSRVLPSAVSDHHRLVADVRLRQARRCLLQ